MKQKYSDDEILKGMDQRLEENKQLLKGLQESVNPRWISVSERLPSTSILKEQFDNRVLLLLQDIGSIVRDNKTLDERYINLIRAKALAILTK